MVIDDMTLEKMDGSTDQNEAVVVIFYYQQLVVLDNY